jgi:hypothetical protein
MSDVRGSQVSWRAPRQPDSTVVMGPRGLDAALVRDPETITMIIRVLET